MPFDVSYYREMGWFAWSMLLHHDGPYLRDPTKCYKHIAENNILVGVLTAIPYTRALTLDLRCRQTEGRQRMRGCNLVLATKESGSLAWPHCVPFHARDVLLMIVSSLLPDKHLAL